eukprot:scaffold81356_cov70-Attheya_sp.AAC.1
MQQAMAYFDPTLSGEAQGCSNDSNDLCVISESLGRLITISTANMMFRGANLASNQRNTTHSLPRIIPLNGTVLVLVSLLGFHDHHSNQATIGLEDA